MHFEGIVVGAHGMLGHCAANVLKKSFNILETSRYGRDGSEILLANSTDEDIYRQFQKIRVGGLVINTVGLLADKISKSDDKESAILVNSLFPHRLSRLASDAGLRFIHISTDAVYSPTSDVVTEDDLPCPSDFYAYSKLAGEVNKGNSLVIRCSIIGPPRSEGGNGLWAWLASQPKGGSVKGFTNQIWKGVTTKQLANFFELLMSEKNFYKLREESAIYNFAPNASMSKYDLLLSIAKHIRVDLKIEPTLADLDITRELVSKFRVLNEMFPQKMPWSQLVRDAMITAN